MSETEDRLRLAVIQLVEAFTHLADIAIQDHYELVRLLPLSPHENELHSKYLNSHREFVAALRKALSTVSENE